MPPRIFLDTSAIFAGIWSATGGGRELLKLAEAKVIDAVVSGDVLKEIDSVIQRKAGERRGELALMLDAARLEIVAASQDAYLTQATDLVSYPKDAIVIAAAWQAEVNYFATLDRQHFIDNAPLAAALPFPVGTPGDCLAWLRDRLSDPDSVDNP